ncbi:nuclear transport factor 2 family protein [Nocardia sp. SC052]|uniref:nuclear transport factor 2 family protein n=1 Tax=Nocardia sichangensis TaxID=3385975 RepID=UPI0039A28786
MYKAFVARQIRHAFAQMNAGDLTAGVGRMAPDAVYEFAGEHALGGRRHGREVITKGFERMGRLFQDGHFEVRDVIVKGWPWKTRIVTIVDITGSLAGEPYANNMIQVLDMRWARITSIYTLEDTQHLAAELKRAGDRGVYEAVAEPIVG